MSEQEHLVARVLEWVDSAAVIQENPTTKAAERIIALVEADIARRMLSAGVDLAALRQRYDHEFETPICHICGDEMSPGMIGEGRIEWSCYGNLEGGAWNEYKPGRSPADQHAMNSHRVTVPRGDFEVVRLIDALAAIGIAPREEAAGE